MSGPSEKRLFGRSLSRVLMIGAAISLCAIGTASASNFAHKKAKHLSLSSIIINGNYTGDFGEVWIAQQAGFFRQQGLNVTLLNSSTSSADQTAILVSGASQFTVNGTSTLLAAAQAQLGVLKSVAAIDQGSDEELIINSATAAAHGIPTTGYTAASAKKQLLALRGSHLTIGVSTTSSDAYVFLAALLKLNGLTIGPNGDVNIVAEGTVPTAIAALRSGKIDALQNTPPNTVQPNTIAIQIHLIPPVSLSTWVSLATTGTFVQQHADTTQAVMNALVGAWHLAKTHPAQALRMVTSMYAQAGITSPEEVSYLFHDTTTMWTNLIPSKAGFSHLVSLINEAGATSINVPASSFLEPRFALQAYKNAGLKP